MPAYASPAGLVELPLLEPVGFAFQFGFADEIFIIILVVGMFHENLLLKVEQGCQPQE